MVLVAGLVVDRAAARVLVAAARRTVAVADQVLAVDVQVAAVDHAAAVVEAGGDGNRPSSPWSARCPQPRMRSRWRS